MTDGNVENVASVESVASVAGTPTPSIALAHDFVYPRDARLSVAECSACGTPAPDDDGYPCGLPLTRADIDGLVADELEWLTDVLIDSLTDDNAYNTGLGEAAYVLRTRIRELRGETVE